MLKLTLLVAVVLLHVVASHPFDVEVLDVNGVKIPTNGDQAGNSKSGQFDGWYHPDKKVNGVKIPVDGDQAGDTGLGQTQDQPGKPGKDQKARGAWGMGGGYYEWQIK